MKNIEVVSDDELVGAVVTTDGVCERDGEEHPESSTHSEFTL